MVVGKVVHRPESYITMNGRGHSSSRLRLQALCFLVIIAFVSEISAQSSLPWWQTSIVYQVYPRSFLDSNGDGIGDLKGITSKLDHFQYLGVDSFWLSPVYKSPMNDFGYDISNFTTVDPIFGTDQDMDDLIKAAHDKGLKVIMDYVPGHTSTEHDWFKRSVNREGNYTDYYVWTNGTLLENGTRVAPNNWLSVFGYSAWKWNDARQQYYYHAFLESQADLNYRNPNVQEEMKNVLRYWLKKGVDGFRVDAIEKLYEVQDLSLNEPPSGLNVPTFQYEYLNHTYTSNQPETIDTVTSWYNVLKEFENADKKPRYMVIELYAEPKVRNQLYNTGGNPFNFDLIDLSPNATGTEIRDRVMNEYNNLPSGKWPNFVLGNHDRRRVSHKFGPLYVDVYNMLLLTLWGTPTTYYGEEIGMLEGIISWGQTVDPWGINFGESGYEQFSRDPERTPMQWTGGYQAGFTTGNKTWLPLGQNYTTINVEAQKNSATMSSIRLYAKLASLRKKPAFQTGTFEVAMADKNIFAFTREGNGEKYLVVINVGKETTTTSFSDYSKQDSANVVAYTPGMQGLTDSSTQSISKVTLKPGDGLVLMLQTGNSGHSLRPGTLTLFITFIHLPLIIPALWAFLKC